MSNTENMVNQCMEVLPNLNENGLRLLFPLIVNMGKDENLLKDTPPERLEEIRKEKELKSEKTRIEFEAEKKAREENDSQLAEWIDKHLNDKKVPERYLLGLDDFMVICNGLILATDKMKIWETADAVYSYGFKRGCNYIKNKQKKAKKKATT